MKTALALLLPRTWALVTFRTNVINVARDNLASFAKRRSRTLLQVHNAMEEDRQRARLKRARHTLRPGNVTA